MDKIKEATRQFRIQQWTGIIHDRMQSGLSIKEYCIKNNLSRDAYFYWARLIRKRALKELPGHAFVELPAVCRKDDAMGLQPGIQSTEKMSSLTLSVNGIDITVTESTSSSLLARTLEVIRDVT